MCANVCAAPLVSAPEIPRQGWSLLHGPWLRKISPDASKHNSRCPLHRQVNGENAFGMARYRELVLTLRPIEAGNPKLGSFWQIRTWPPGLGAAVICIDRIGFVLANVRRAFLAPRPSRLFHSFHQYSCSPIPAPSPVSFGANSGNP